MSAEYSYRGLWLVNRLTNGRKQLTDTLNISLIMNVFEKFTNTIMHNTLTEDLQFKQLTNKPTTLLQNTLTEDLQFKQLTNKPTTLLHNTLFEDLQFKQLTNKPTKLL